MQVAHLPALHIQRLGHVHRIRIHLDGGHGDGAVIFQSQPDGFREVVNLVVEDLRVVTHVQRNSVHGAHHIAPLEAGFAGGRIGIGEGDFHHHVLAVLHAPQHEIHAKAFSVAGDAALERRVVFHELGPPVHQRAALLVPKGGHLFHRIQGIVPVFQFRHHRVPPQVVGIHDVIGEQVGVVFEVPRGGAWRNLFFTGKYQ